MSFVPSCLVIRAGQAPNGSPMENKHDVCLKIWPPWSLKSSVLHWEEEEVIFHSVEACLAQWVRSNDIGKPPLCNEGDWGGSLGPHTCWANALPLRHTPSTPSTLLHFTPERVSPSYLGWPWTCDCSVSAGIPAKELSFQALITVQSLNNFQRLANFCDKQSPNIKDNISWLSNSSG